MRIDVLKRINKSLSPNKVDFSAVDNELNTLKKKLEETVNIQTVDDVSRKLKQFQERINFKPLIDEITNIKELFNSRTKELESILNTKTKEIVIASEERNESKVFTLQSEVNNIKNELSKSEVLHSQSIDILSKQITESKSIEGQINKVIENIKDNIIALTTKEEAKKSLQDIQELIEELRRDLAKISGRGGSANQQINVNSSIMSAQFADINFVSDTAIKWVATNDTINKRVNIQASIISGGTSAGRANKRRNWGAGDWERRCSRPRRGSIRFSPLRRGRTISAAS